MMGLVSGIQGSGFRSGIEIEIEIEIEIGTLRTSDFDFDFDFDPNTHTPILPRTHTPLPAALVMHPPLRAAQLHQR